MTEKKIFGGNPYFGTNSRARIFRALVIIMAVAFIGRLAQLQILEGAFYKSESEAQAIKKLIIEPFRGNMFDRTGELIVHNEPSFSVTLTPNNFKMESIPLLISIIPDIDTMEVIKGFSVLYPEKTFNNEIIPKLDSMIGISAHEIRNRMPKHNYYSRFTPIKIYRDADYEEIALIEEYNDFLPGIDVIVESKRLYEFDAKMAHILGFTREISKEELKEKSYYRPGDVIGKRGIEKSYEKLLRGNPGVQFIAVNSRGKKVSSFDNGKKDLGTSKGFDLYLSIDKRTQEAAEKALEKSKGAIVAIDPQTGEVIALASNPQFDPRDFTGRISRETFNTIYSNPDNPMFNRAIQSSNSPGSTWKMLIAIAALQEGIINENTTMHCAGGYHYGGRFWRCHAVDGNIAVRRAIKVSCNSFFYQLGLKLGMEKFEKYGKMFGFGQKTHIDIPGEKKGILPTMDWLESNKSSGGFQKGKLLNYGIGQGEIQTTPLQMAVYTAAIANKGTIHQPHVVRKVYSVLSDRIEDINFESKELPVDEKVFNIIRDGMYAVVNEPGGTASNARIPGYDVCGKTGTAQNPHGKPHAWFVSFAPKDDPQIALCVFVENEGYGGAVAAPKAKQVMEAFFRVEKENEIITEIPVEEQQESVDADSLSTITQNR